MRRLPRPVTHVVFDLDGVLLDTEPLYTAATCRIVGRFGRCFDWSLKSVMMGRLALESARIVVERLDLPLTAEAFHAERTAILAELLPEAAAMPGAPELVAALATRRVPMGLATSSPRSLVEPTLVRHRGWLASLEVIVTGDDPRVVRGKPAPDIYLVAVRDLGAAPAACVAIEDAPVGVEAARAAGMQVIAVPDARLVDRARLETLATLVVASLAELGPETLGL